MAENFITYKGRPLVRTGPIIFYGDQNEKCYTMLTILDSKQQKDLMVSGKVEIQLLLTDNSVPPAEALIKKTEQEGLYKAMDVAAIWLDMANAEK